MEIYDLHKLSSEEKYDSLQNLVTDSIFRIASATLQMKSYDEKFKCDMYNQLLNDYPLFKEAFEICEQEGRKRFTRKDSK